MESTKIRLTINPRRIAHLKFVLESYDGLALLKTEDPTAGRVIMYAGRGAEEELAALLDSMKDDLGIIGGLSDELPHRREPAAGILEVDA